MHLSVDILAGNDQRLPGGRPESRVQGWTIFCCVDVIATKHRVSTLFQPDLIGHLNESIHDGGSDQVLGQVNIQITCSQCELLDTIWVSVEPDLQVWVEISRQ